MPDIEQKEEKKMSHFLVQIVTNGEPNEAMATICQIDVDNMHFTSVVGERATDLYDLLAQVNSWKGES